MTGVGEVGEVGEVVEAVGFKGKLRSELKGRRGRGASDEDITELLSSGVGGESGLEPWKWPPQDAFSAVHLRNHLQRKKWKRPNGSEHGGEVDKGRNERNQDPRAKSKD